MKNINQIYVTIMGGIGDQIFQYSYATYLKKKLNSVCYLDTCYYLSKKNYNNFIFRLKHIAEKNNFLIDNKISYFGYDKISYLRFIEYFKINKFIPIIYKFFFNKPIKYFIYDYWNKKKTKYVIKNNSYYFGYWHKLKYVSPIKKNINNNLINYHLSKPKLKKFIKKNIKNTTIAIHIRGGDFAYQKSHNLLDEAYYNQSINYYKKKLKKINFHVFTNDLKFAKKILAKNLKIYKFIFIKSYNFIDIEEFSLFSWYKYSIIANSTFSLLSSYLSYNRSLCLAPKIWLKGEKLEKNKMFSKLKFI